MPPRSRPDEPFDGRVPPPQQANVETTKFCNLRCRMCVQFNDGTTVSGPHMPLEEFERIAYSVFPYVERWQPSVAGEPTMSRGFEQMLAIAEQFGVKSDVFTNGTLLSEAMIEQLAPNLGCLTISFDGATKATFESIREGAVYEDVVGKVRRLVAWSRKHLPANHQPSFYVLEFSLDGFLSILFSTKGEMGGPAIREPRYAVPPWAWREAPVDREIDWRVFAQVPSGRHEVQRGSVPPEPVPERDNRSA